MKKLLTATIASTMLCFTGCATIIKGSTQTVSFRTVPENSKIEIVNRKGQKIHTGETPATVSLKKGSGYFKPENYQVTFSKPGYESKTVNVEGKMSGWYIGNLVFGGIIGLLIVDPLTGAMYKLTPDDVETVLNTKNVKTSKDSLSLTIMLKENIPTDVMARATMIQQ